jgi:hypothetical protein
MQEVITWDMEDRSPYEIISALPGVTRIDTNAHTHDLGRFNIISVTNETYSENQKWFDSKLAALFERTTQTDKLDKSDFPNPVRMGRRNTHRPPPAPRNLAYTDYLKSQYQTTVGTPPPPKKPKPNAWHNRRVEPTFDYEVHYPAMQPPVPPPRAITTPGHHTILPLPPTPTLPTTPAPSSATLSTATPSTMTDVETRLYIEECVQTEQTKLVASTALIAADISQLREEFKTMLHESKQTQTATMQGFIREAISANTKNLTTEGTSPFVTQAELGRQLGDFKNDFLAMFHPPPPTAHMAITGEHPLPYGPYGYPPAYLIRLHQQAQQEQVPTGAVVTPERDPKRARDHSPEHVLGEPILGADKASNDVKFFDASNDPNNPPALSPIPLSLLGTQPLETSNATAQPIQGGASI